MKKGVKVSWLNNGAEYFGVTVSDVDGGFVPVAATASFNADLDGVHPVTLVSEKILVAAEPVKEGSKTLKRASDPVIL